jgi:hypothetical protein
MKSAPTLLVMGAVACACDIAAPLVDRGRSTEPAQEAGTPNVGAADATAGALDGDAADPIGAIGSLGPTPSAEQARQRCAQSNLAPPMLRRLTRGELERTILGVFPDIATDWKGSRLGPDPSSSLHFSNDANVLVVGTQTAAEVARTAKDVAALIVAPEHLGAILGCSRASPGAACVAAFLDAFGPRLYRRPLTAQERGELADYYAAVSARSDFVTGLKWTVTVMLESPEFLYRSEMGDERGRLDPYEVATALSYTFGGTAPSEALLGKAARGELGDTETLHSVAESLQATEAGRDVLRRFLREWSGSERVLGMSKDLVVNFFDVQNWLLAETNAFFDDVIFASRGGMKDLLTAPYTFVDLNLAGYYGIAPAATAGFAKIVHPLNRPSGLLGQGSILAGNSHSSATSPTFRGLFVLSRLLCATPPPPPATVPPLEASPPASTTRERYEKSHAEGACQSCHRLFDPIGFAFEQYDETGRYRSFENGHPLDTHTTVTLSDGSTRDVQTLDDLGAVLAADTGVTDCVSGLLATYAFGGGGGRTCLAEEARAALSVGQFGLARYFVELARAPSFLERRR